MRILSEPFDWLTLHRSLRYWLASNGFLFVQAVAVMAALSFTLTGSRIAAIDRYGNRADIVATIVVTIATVALLRVLNRRAKSAIDRRFFREQYDARRILTAMSAALRTASSIQEVLETAADQISAALHPRNVTIFLEDEEKNGYVIALSSGPGKPSNSMPASLSTVRLPYDAALIDRFRTSPQPAASQVTVADLLRRDNSSGSNLTAEADRALAAVNSSLLIPISINHEVNGFISLADRRSGLPYMNEDKLIMLVVANQIATFIENEKIIRRRAEEERKARELQMAAEVQRHLFPANGLNKYGLEIYGICLPAQEVGGDYYDYFQIDGRRVGLAIADVAGKGIAAALLMSTVQASLRCQFLASQKSLPKVVASINQLLQRSTNDGSYATFFLAEFDRETRQLTYVNAGHNPPLLASLSVANEPEVRRLTIGGPIIGVFVDRSYQQETVPLTSGDLLCIYTDGVTEALSPDGAEFGEQRLRSILVEARPFDARRAAEHVIAKVVEWQGHSPQHDDITLIVMKVK